MARLENFLGVGVTYFIMIMMCNVAYCANMSSIQGIGSSNLSFGKMDPGASGGSIDSSCTTTGTIGSFGGCCVKKFLVTGSSNTTFLDLVFPNDDLRKFRVYIMQDNTLTRVGGGAASEVTQFLNPGSLINMRDYYLSVESDSKNLR